MLNFFSWNRAEFGKISSRTNFFRKNFFLQKFLPLTMVDPRWGFWGLSPNQIFPPKINLVRFSKYYIIQSFLIHYEFRNCDIFWYLNASVSVVFILRWYFAKQIICLAVLISFPFTIVLHFVFSDRKSVV